MAQEKFTIKSKGKPDIVVMFNPETISDEYTSKLTKDQCKSKVFTKVNRSDFQVELLFDTYVKTYESIPPVMYATGMGKPLKYKSVRDLTGPIKELMMPTVTGKEKDIPPVCTFSWKKVLIEGYITKFSEKFILFFPDGTPARSRVTLTITENETYKEAMEAMGKDKCRKVHMVKQNDRLDLVAYKTLRDPRLWREIVNENSSAISNPRVFPGPMIGAHIIIPDHYKVQR